jgi:hypothetical protein
VNVSILVLLELVAMWSMMCHVPFEEIQGISARMQNGKGSWGRANEQFIVYIA